MRIPTRYAALLGLLLAVGAPSTGSAQSFTSSARAECVGGAIGCQQVDIFLEFLGLPAGETWLDYFTISDVTPAWQLAFPGTAVASDAWGLNFYTPDMIGQTLTGRFDLGAVLDPALSSTLRIRAEFTHDPTAFGDASTLAFNYEAGSGTQALTAGSLRSTTTTPEPISIALLGTGLAGVGVAARRRRRGVGKRLA